MPHSVLSAFGIDKNTAKVETISNGLINKTWKIITPKNAFILQQVNKNVFTQPENIAHNISRVARHIQQYYPEYYFVAPVAAANGKELVCIEEKYYRLFPFVAGSHTIDVVATAAQAYEAAAQFGKFTYVLKDIDIAQLKITIPSFHDLSLRYQQFLSALETGNKERIARSEILINDLKSNATIVSAYEKIKSNPAFKLRVTHHDTKISNVLFDKKGKGICVIDLDTIMPGYFISDVGDMMRTYLSPVSEEEKEYNKIEIRDDFYFSIVRGYMSAMQNELTATESKSFFYAGKFMIYMQAIRFLTDYINDDAYYGAKYPDHNFVRANNQFVLLQKLVEKESILADF